MTPLAQAILDDYTKPLARRIFARNGVDTDVQAELVNAHAFDLTAVHEMVAPLGLKMSEQKDGALGRVEDTRLAFLPAPTCWIEYRLGEPPPQRHGVLLLEAGELAICVICVGNGSQLNAVAEFALPLSGFADFGQIRIREPKVEWVSQEWIACMFRDIYAMLAMINTPRVIGRRQIMPHAGLQRKLAAARGMVGKFPLHAWSEVLLSVTPPILAEGEHEARLTGGKALHFCRSHLRIQNGKLVLVSAHWRGDPALGMKQTRYRLTPPKSST